MSYATSFWNFAITCVTSKLTISLGVIIPANVLFSIRRSFLCLLGFKNLAICRWRDPAVLLDANNNPEAPSKDHCTHRRTKHISSSYLWKCCRLSLLAVSDFVQPQEYKRFLSIAKIPLQVGRQEPVMVIRVDKEKGYIDLSKRRVSPEDIAACEDKFNKSKMVHSIMRHVAELTGEDVEKLYESIGWPLYKLYGHAFEAFKVYI